MSKYWILMSDELMDISRKQLIKDSCRQKQASYNRLCVDICAMSDNFHSDKAH